MTRRLFRFLPVLWFTARAALAVEIAGDVTSDRGDATIRVGTALYACRPGSPPLAHSWSYECNPASTRSLATSLRVDCAKCARECPGVFADDFCARCRRFCE